MEGKFKGWISGKTFGFIDPDDGSEAVFVHQSETVAWQKMRQGARLRFEVEETAKGRKACNIQIASQAPVGNARRGKVKFWSDKGYGFIEPSDGSKDVYVHVTTLPPEEDEHLPEGLVVDFYSSAGQRGEEASAITVVEWRKIDDPLANFADMGKAGWLEKLASMAEPEPWDYKQVKASEPLPILRSYFRYTFQRLEEMSNGISYSRDDRHAAINTGLVTPNQEEIYALFRRNERKARQPWKLYGFKKSSDWDFVDNFGSSPPPLADYFDDPSVLLYDRRCELYINYDHVMENIERFPKHLQENKYVARQLLTSAEATTKKRVYRNYKTAIPQYYRDRGKAGSVQLLLPICLENPTKADFALVAEKSDSSNAYRCSTILTLDMAYNNARLLARPDTEWLQP